MTKYFVFVCALVAANVAFFYLGGAAWLGVTLSGTVAPEEHPLVRPEMVDVFAYTLEDEVVKKVGQPIEGFEPHMFLSVFPGLVETDFNGVAASGGTYRVEQGKLVFVPDTTKLVHSAATAVTKAGMATLLTNVALRTQVDLGGNGTITDVMTSIITR